MTEPRTAYVGLKLSPAERRAIDAAAHRAELTVSELARTATLAAAECVLAAPAPQPLDGADVTR